MDALSGKKALAEIDEILGKARGNLARVDAEFGGARTMLAGLRQSELGVYARLAKLRLLAIEQGGLVDALNDADRQAADILEQRALALVDLDLQIAAAEAALKTDEARRDEQQVVVAVASEALDAAEAEAQAELAADLPYAAQLAATEHADFVADQAEDKAEAARADRIEKGKPYEADPLFAYLWSRGYGTSAYRAWPLARWLDGKVAKLCDYEPARRDYALLVEIPDRLAEHAASMRTSFDGEAAALAALEEAAAAAAGVPERRDELGAEEQALAGIDAEIEAGEEALRALVEERKAYASGEDDLYRSCIELLSTTLQRESIQLLTERAARTPAREDDQLVRRLVMLDHEAGQIEQNLEEFRRLHERESDRLGELENLRRRFKAERYDDPLSEFKDAALFVLVLREFLRGATGASDVWKTIKRQQRTRRVKSDPHFGTLRFPRAPKDGPWRMPKGGGFGSGGGFKGGGFRTGGGFRGGGGFKTGGGF